jgi:hypothetical protein
MKNLLFAMLVMLSTSIYAQTYATEDKVLTGVFETQGKTKVQIYSAINKWISVNYNSGKSVTQLSDVDAGNIVVKGINEVSYPNISKIIYPNMKSIPDIATMKLNHLIEINIKDNKFRIIYKIVDFHIDLAMVGYMTPEMIKISNDCINLNGISDAALLANFEFMDMGLKKGMIGKEKRDQVKEAIKPTYDELNRNLIANMKTTMLSIQSAVTASTTDVW